MSREEKFDTYLKELRTNRKKQQKPEESMPNFQIDFLQLLEEGHAATNGEGRASRARRTGLELRIGRFYFL